SSSTAEAVIESPTTARVRGRSGTGGGDAARPGAWQLPTAASTMTATRPGANFRYAVYAASADVTGRTTSPTPVGCAVGQLLVLNVSSSSRSSSLTPRGTS